MRQLPKVGLHKATGQATIWLNRKCHYLGKWGTPQVERNRDRLLAEWLARGRRPKPDPAKTSVGGLVEGYMGYAATYFRKLGNPTKRLAVVKAALKTPLALYADLPAGAFGIPEFKAVRDEWIRRDLSRKTIVAYTYIVRQCWTWGVEQELVPAEAALKLRAIQNLRRGRSEAKETEPVLPADPAAVEAILPRLKPVVRAMVQVQLLTGMRPCEVRGMRPVDVDRSGDVWLYTVTEQFNKNSARGRPRLVFIGPKARAILAPWLDGTPSPTTFIFRPAERRHCGRRKTPPGWSGAGYVQAIRRACEKAGVAPFAPNRLRHLAATLIRKEAGDIQAARVVLGHGSVQTTEIYAQPDWDVARRIAARMG